jgi:putative ubiquitin-RnfH superfamily antitoxin RatB of RatAB toxin-antitoxin module
MRCTVSYALPQQQWVWAVELPPGADVAAALAAAAAQLTPADAQQVGVSTWRLATVGIFGRICDRSFLLAEGDRVEIYRPLAVDPKESRRERARWLKKN